jgi:hypothetical protein
MACTCGSLVAAAFAAASAAGLLLFLLLSFNTLAGVQSKVAQFLKDVVGSEYDPLLGPPLPEGAVGQPPPYIPFKGGSHVE